MGFLSFSSLLLLPYLALYLLFWHFHWPVRILTSIFQAMHVALGAGLLVVALRRWRAIGRFDAVFWVSLFLGFLAGGAYLEFPSDAWEHYARIFSWEGKWLVVEHGTRQRFAYYWVWTLLGGVVPVWRHVALDFYAAVWQLLVALYFYLLLRKLGFEKRLAWLQVFTAVVFFGTGVFSFRYYALSSTPMAYVFYLQALIFILEGFEGRRTQWIWVPALFAAIYFNHTQEMVFLLLNGFGIAMYFLLRGRPRALRWTIGLALFVGAVVGALALGRGWALPLEWDAHSRVATTYGLPGLIGLLSAAFLFRSRPLFALLCALPLAVLIWPPSGLGVSAATTQAADSYRLLYAFPICFAFALGVEGFFRRLPGWVGKHSLPVAAVVILFLSSIFPYPWLGRGVFQFYRPPGFLELNWLPQTWSWFGDLGGPRLQCPLASDPVTTFALRWSLPEFPFEEVKDTRLNALSAWHTVASENELVSLVDKNGICGFLVMDPQARAAWKIPRSRVGRWSGHWNEHHVEIALKLPDRFYLFMDALTRKGWDSQPVPPFFTLWTRPGFMRIIK